MMQVRTMMTNLSVSVSVSVSVCLCVSVYACRHVTVSVYVARLILLSAPTSSYALSLTGRVGSVSVS